MRKWCDVAGLDQPDANGRRVSAHGVRKRVASDMAERGATEAQMNAALWSPGSKIAGTLHQASRQGPPCGGCRKDPKSVTTKCPDERNPQFTGTSDITLQARRESNPLWRGFGDRRSTDELHASIGTNWRTRTALTRSTAVRHHPIGLVGIEPVARPRAARGARPL